MKGPQISWFIKEPDNTLAPYQEYYAGSYRPSESMFIQVQVWNNRWGQEKVENAIGARLSIFFDTIEDSAILNLCSVKIDGEDYKNLIIEGNKGYVDIGTLSGNMNDGSINSIDNYLNVTIKFGPVLNNMKNSLKNMFIDLEFDSQEGGL